MQGEAPGSKGTETPVLPAVFAEPAGRGDLAPALLSTLRALPHSEPGARPHALFPRPPLEWTLSAGQSPDPESLGQGWTHSGGGGVSAQRKGGPVPEPPDSGADVGLCHHLLFKKQRDHACHPLNTAVCPAKLTFFLRGRGSPSVNLELNTFLVEKICVLKNKSRSPVSNRPGEEENNKLPPRWEEATMIAQRRALMKCSWKLRVKFVINLESQGLAFSAGK